MVSGTSEIPLSQGYVAIVDVADYAELMKFRWHVSVTNSAVHGFSVYARRKISVNGKTVSVYMHRQIMGEPEGKIVDHKDRNTLNNSRRNLRIATPIQSSTNRVSRKPGSSRFHGVCRAGSGYSASVKTAGVRVWRKYFSNETEAAIARDKVARQVHGEFAVLNFPEPAQGQLQLARAGQPGLYGIAV